MVMQIFTVRRQLTIPFISSLFAECQIQKEWVVSRTKIGPKGEINEKANSEELTMEMNTIKTKAGQ